MNKRFNWFIGFVFLFAFNALSQNEIAPPLNPYEPPPGFGTPDPSLPPSTMDPSLPPMPDGGVPLPPSSEFPPFDPYADDGGFGDEGFGGSEGSSQREGKDSMRLVEPQKDESCQLYKNELLKNKKYEDFNDCQADLDQFTDRAKRLMESNEDDLERYKLKRVIKGELNRERSKEYKYRFVKLHEYLKNALAHGCKCKS